MKKKLLKALIGIVIVILLIGLIMLGIREIYKFNNAQKLKIDGPNIIDEQMYVEIGGIDQWITIRGEDRANPILLTVPGGPGSTYTVFNSLLREWEKHFTVVQWDPRGAGKTFGKNGIEGSGSLTFDLLVHDGIELSEYLLEYFGQEKLILLGSSVGSIIAMKMVKEKPELFHAYVGTDQNVGADPNHISYNLAVNALEEADDEKKLQEVASIGPDKSLWSQEEFDTMNKIMVNLMPGVPHMIKDLNGRYMFFSPDHGIKDIINIFNGMNFSLDMLFEEIMAFDAYELSLDYDLPFFIFHGESDIITPTALAKEYFDAVEAPHKEFVFIKDAGHLAAFAQPDQFLEELIQRVRPLVEE